MNVNALSATRLRLMALLVVILATSPNVVAFAWPGGGNKPGDWGVEINFTNSEQVLYEKVLSPVATEQIVISRVRASSLGWSNDNGGTLQYADTDTVGGGVPVGVLDETTQLIGSGSISLKSTPSNNLNTKIASSTHYVLGMKNNVIIQQLDSDCTLATGNGMPQKFVACGYPSQHVDRHNIGNFKELHTYTYWTDVISTVCNSPDKLVPYKLGTSTRYVRKGTPGNYYSGILGGSSRHHLGELSCRTVYKTLALRTENNIDFGNIYQDGIQTTRDAKVVDMSIVFDGSATTSFPSSYAYFTVDKTSDASCGGPVLKSDSGNGAEFSFGTRYDLSVLNKPIGVEWVSPGNCTAGAVQARRKFTVSYY